ncbi:MAG: phosphodiester glycosidase family protein [Christensenella sp.]|nr:phosphodiester glycosidase family protein [Christensenella sp.]
MRLKSVYDSKFFRSAAAFFLLSAMLLPAFASARAEESTEPADLTSGCSVTLPERSVAFESRLTDDNYNSRISFNADESLALTLPSGAKGLYVGWYAAPEAATIESLDASGTVIQSVVANPDLLNGYYLLPEKCAGVRVISEKKYAISEVRVYDTETAPDALCVMSAQQGPVKVMVMMAHTADESYYFGSLLPYLNGGDAALAFLSSENRQMQQQTIEAMYALGSRTQPIFGSFPYYPSAIEIKKLYTYIEKIDVNNWLIQLIRRYQPDTIITHAAIGEDAEGMHELTSKHVLLALDLAADASKEYVSEKAYGVWQVRAVYQHLTDGTSALYDTNAPLAAFGGQSAVSLAQAAFDRYTTYQVYRASVTDTPYFVQTYPADVAMSQEQSASDLFTILSSLKSPAAQPEAAATPAPTETPAPEETTAPEAAQQPAQESAEATSTPTASADLRYLGVALALLGVIGLAAGIILFRRGGDEKKRWLIVACVSAGVILLLIGVGMVYQTIKAQNSAQTTVIPTPSPTATQTAPTATAAATPEPAEEEDAFASHFRKASDPEEVVVFDDENGIYEYRNDTLAIEIRRYEKTEPMVAYYVAHIYERDVDSYRSGFGSARLNGRDTADACVMARRYRAVLGMTGDNLLHSDYNRGMMMRDGRIFRAMTQASVMTLTEDFSMRIYNAKDNAMLNEIDAGIQDTFAFGPPLILNGVLCEKVDDDRVGRINPRAGLGMVEPGHFVAIVVDGRLPHYSHGMLLSDYAKLFLDEGCVMAYNLDGGASATMVFMGEYINKRAENHYRSVPDQLLWGYSELVPTENDPYQLQGSVSQDWVKGN